jgi:transposase
VTRYREQGEDALAVQPQGRPPGAGRALSPEQEDEIRTLVVDSTPQQQQIASATWTRHAVAELIASRLGLELTLQGVGKYLRRWRLTPQQPARQAREQDPEAVREFVEQKLPEVQEQAEAEDAPLHLIDEVGVKAQDQIGTSYAPQGDTPVLEVPKTPIEQDVISSVTGDGELFYWPFPGTMTAPKFIDFLERLGAEATTKIIVFADHPPAHEAEAVEAWLEALYSTPAKEFRVMRTLIRSLRAHCQAPLSLADGLAQLLQWPISLAIAQQGLSVAESSPKAG